MGGWRVFRGVGAVLGLGLLACTPIDLENLSPLPSASPGPDTPEVTPTVTPMPTSIPTPSPTPVPPLQDRDDDGYASDVDCNDRNPSAYPGAVEFCDGVDNNCNGTIDEDLPQITSWPDLDDDGYGNTSIPSESCSVPQTNVQQPGDCDDDDPTVNPGMVESCNNKDDDCDDAVDEIAEYYWADDDADGFGNGAQMPELLCEPGAGFVQNPYDCDDSDAALAPLLVSTRGSSAGTGTFDSPFSQLGPALTTLPNGCLSVLVEPGVYSEAITQTPLEGLKIQALSSTQETVLTAPSGQSPLTLLGAKSLTMDGFVVQGLGEVGRAGACMRIEDANAVTLKNMVIKECRAGGQFNGGGMAILRSQAVRIETSIFAQNTAQNGGALFVDTSKVVLLDVLLENNSARYSGGAIYVDSTSKSWNDASVLIDRSLLQDNWAKDSGGGASANEFAWLDAVDSHFYGNYTQDRFGGAVNNPTRVLRCTFIENVCKGLDNSTLNYADGGALTLRQSSDVYNSIFIANEAQYAGAINLYELSSSTSTSGDAVHRVFQNTFVDQNARAPLTPGDTFHAFNGDQLEFQNNLIVNRNGLNQVAFYFLDLMDYDVDFTYFGLDDGEPFGGLDWSDNANFYRELNPELDPIFQSYVPGQYYSANLRLAQGCPAINGGNPATPLDADGSLPDAGAYGGPDAAGWE